MAKNQLMLAYRSPRSKAADPAAAPSAVVDEMVASIGAITGPIGLPAIARAQSRRWRSGAAVALTAALVASAVGAGVLTGIDMARVPASVVFSPNNARPHAMAPVAIATGQPIIIKPGPVTRMARVTELTAKPARVPAAAPWAEPIGPDTRPLPPTIMPPEELTAAAERPPPLPNRRRATMCDDDEACVGDRIDQADRTLADAFDRAVAAGVNRRLLRGYGREWDRAWSEADDRPGETLRLFAMITHDLRSLARDADDREPR